MSVDYICLCKYAVCIKPSTDDRFSSADFVGRQKSADKMADFVGRFFKTDARFSSADKMDDDDDAAAAVFLWLVNRRRRKRKKNRSVWVQPWIMKRLVVGTVALDHAERFISIFFLLIYTQLNPFLINLIN